MPKAKVFNAALQSLKNQIPKGMFSTLDELIDAAPQERMTPQKWREYLAPGRVLEREDVAFPLKKEELEYAKLEDVLGSFLDNPVDKQVLRDRIYEKRPKIYRNDDPEDERFSRYSTQGPYRKQYLENQTFMPSMGEYPTHFEGDTISWHRGTRHDTRENQGILRLIDEIQSDRHSAAAEKMRVTPDGSLTPDVPGDNSTYPTTRRGYRTPEQEAELKRYHTALTAPDSGELPADYRQSTNNEFLRLNSIPPDAPFKGSPDYGRLEIKQGLLDAVGAGDSFLGITPSEGPIGWFQSGPGQQPGMKEAYDRVYPGELKKLARQYGAEFRDAPINVTDRKSVVTNRVLADQLMEVDAVDMPDYLDMISQGHYEDHANDLDNLVKGFVIPEGNKGFRTEQNQIQRMVTEFKKKADDHDNGRYDVDDDVFAEMAEKIHARILGLDNALHGANPAQTIKTRNIPSMVLTPDIREKIKRIGVPIWSLAGTAAGLGAIGQQDRDADAQAFAEGGRVEKKPSRAIQMIDQVADRVAERVPFMEHSLVPHQYASGLLSQLYGLDTKGDTKFLGFDPTRKVSGASMATSPLAGILSMFRPGIVDDTESLPDMFGNGPEWAKKAGERSEENQAQISHSMRDLPAPSGFGENLAYAGGIMSGQLPVPEAAAAKAIPEGTKMMSRIGSLAKKYGTGASEFFVPTIHPSVGSYASGSAFGGALGTMPEWLQSFAESHPELVEAMFREDTPEVKDYLANHSREDETGYASGGMVGINDPRGQQISRSPMPPAPITGEYIPAPRTYVGSPKTEAELAHYGEGPEATYYANNNTSGAIPVDFSKDGSGYVGPTATKGGGNNAAVGILGSLPQIYKGIGMADKVLGTGMQGALKGVGTKALGALGIGSSGGAPLAAMSSGALDAAAAQSLAGVNAALGTGAAAEGAATGAGVAAGGSGFGGTLAALASNPLTWGIAGLAGAGLVAAKNAPKSSPLNHYDQSIGGWTKPENFGGQTYTPDQLNSYYGPAIAEFRKSNDVQAALRMLPEPRNAQEAALAEGAKHLFSGTGNPLRKEAKTLGLKDGEWKAGNKNKKTLISSLKNVDHSAYTRV